MRSWSAERVASAVGARLLREPQAARSPGEGTGPQRVSIDSRTASPGELFVGLRGERSDGGAHAAEALRSGAWGVLVGPEHADGVVGAPGGAVLVHADPLAALQALALAWRRELGTSGAKVIGVTGSTGKTSTKDIITAIAAAQRRTISSPENFNTEIGLPLALLAAPADTQVLVLEMAMRGVGQIAELTAIAEPDVGVIVNVGPVHLELLGSVKEIAAAKAELIAGLAPGATVVLPAAEPLLAPHLRADLSTLTFGEGADVALVRALSDGQVVIDVNGRELTVRPSFAQAHNLRNLLAAVGACQALGIDPPERLDVRFSALRGERLELPGGAVLINDCYNANPMSMRAALDDLAETASGRRVGVLGDMLELGPGAAELHREIGLYADARGVELLLSVGPLAAEMRGAFAGESHAAADAEGAAALLGDLLRDDDTVLVKGSRGVGLERVATALGARTPASASEPAAVDAQVLGTGPRAS